MKHWFAVLWIALAAGGMTWLRRSYRDRLIAWSARRVGTSIGHGRRTALMVHLAAAMLALLVTIGGLLAWSHGGTLAAVRYPAALIVLLGYVPMAMVAAPKLTKWQKSHERRLIEAGAARDGARGWDSVARVFSVFGALLSLVALFLLVVTG